MLEEQRLRRHSGDDAKMVRVLVVVMLVGLSTSCGKSDGKPTAIETSGEPADGAANRRPPVGHAIRVVDSASIRIVDIADVVPEDLQTWTLDSSLLADIGFQNGEEYQMDDADLFRRFSNGDIVVTFSGLRGEIRIFDSAGQFLRRFGRSGEGPGEFRSISAIHVDAADTLWVFDPTLGRTSVFTQDGKLARTFQLTGVPSKYWYSTPGGLAGGRWIFSHHVPIMDPKGRHRDTVEIAIADPEGRSSRVLARMPDFLRVGGVPVLYTPMAFAWPMDSIVLVGVTDRYAVQGLSADGKTRFIYRRNVPLLATPESTIKQVSKGWQDQGRFGEPPVARTLPIMQYFKPDAAGNIWVLNYRLNDREPIQWTIIGQQGAIVARSTISQALWAAVIGVDDVIQLEEVGEDRIKHLRRYRLRKAGR